MGREENTVERGGGGDGGFREKEEGIGDSEEEKDFERRLRKEWGRTEEGDFSSVFFLL